MREKLLYVADSQTYGECIGITLPVASKTSLPKGCLLSVRMQAYFL